MSITCDFPREKKSAFGAKIDNKKRLRQVHTQYITTLGNCFRRQNCNKQRLERQNCNKPLAPNF